SHSRRTRRHVRGFPDAPHRGPRDPRRMTNIANVEMAAAWDGQEGDDWTENAERYEATGRYFAAEFFAKMSIADADHVLDVGCGTGLSTRDAARAARDGTVLGVDLSSRMLEYARQRTREEGLTNVEYLQA